MSDLKGKDRSSEPRLSTEAGAAQPLAPQRSQAQQLRTDFGQIATAANAAAIGMGLATQTSAASALDAQADGDTTPHQEASDVSGTTQSKQARPETSLFNAPDTLSEAAGAESSDSAFNTAHPSPDTTGAPTTTRITATAFTPQGEVISARPTESSTSEQTAHSSPHTALTGGSVAGVHGSIAGEDGLLDGPIDLVGGEDGLLETLTGESGIVTGTLDAVAGEDGLLDNTLDLVAGEDGLLETLAGESGIVTGTLDAVAGEDGLLDNTLDLVAGEDGLIETLTGESGIVIGTLDAIAEEEDLLDSTLDLVAGEDGLLETVTGESGIVTGTLDAVAGEEGLLDNTLDLVAGDEGLLGGLLGLDSTSEEQTAEGEFLDTLLLSGGDDEMLADVLDGLLGEDDPFALSADPADSSTLDPSTSELLAGLGIEDDLSGSLVDEGILDPAAMDIEDSAEVDALLTEILGSAVDGDLFSGAQGAFDSLLDLGDSESDTANMVAEGDDSLLGDAAVDGTLNGLFESGSGDGLLADLLGGDSGGLDSENS